MARQVNPMALALLSAGGRAMQGNTVGEALGAGADGSWQMISPTLITLESIARHDKVSAVFTAVAAGTHLPELTASLNQQGMQTLR